MALFYSSIIPINIPYSLKLTITHEQFIELAIANRDLQLEISRNFRETPNFIG